MQYIIGQFMGILATVACIIVPLFKYKWQMLLNIIAVNLLMLLNFVLIGQIGSAAFLCAVAVVQSIFQLVHYIRKTDVRPAEKVIFPILYIVLGVFGLVTAPGFVPAVNTRNLIELLPICGALASMVFVFVRDEQKARVVLLITSGIWATYAAIVGATTFFAQAASIATTLAAMYKYRKAQAEPKAN